MACLKTVKPGNTVTAINSALGGIRLQYGSITITPKPNEQTSKHVTFPVAFSGKPELFITPRSSVAGKVLLGFGTMSSKEDGFDIYMLRTNDTDTIFSWFAIGPI